MPARLYTARDEEPLTWISVRGSLAKVRRVAVCAACYIDLRAIDAEIDDGGADD